MLALIAASGPHADDRPLLEAIAEVLAAVRLALEGGRFELDGLPQNDSPARRSGDAPLTTAGPASRSQRRDGQA